MGVGWAAPCASEAEFQQLPHLFTGNPSSPSEAESHGREAGGQGYRMPVPGAPHPSPDPLFSTAVEPTLSREGGGPARVWRSWKPWQMGHCPVTVISRPLCVQRGEQNPERPRRGCEQEPAGTGSPAGGRSSPLPTAACVCAGGERVLTGSQIACRCVRACGIIQLVMLEGKDTSIYVVDKCSKLAALRRL